MTNLNQKRYDYEVQELKGNIQRFIPTIEEVSAVQIAKEIYTRIDWANESMMHKGFSWMVKRYLTVQGML